MLTFDAESPPSESFHYALWAQVFNAALDDPHSRVNADELRRLDTLRGTSHIYTRRTLVRENGEVVGCALASHLIYLFDPGRFWVWVAVLPAHRGRGLGSAIFNEMLSALRASLAPTELMCHANQNAPHSLGFLQRQGFEVRQRFVSSHLQVSRVDYARLPPLVATLRAQGIEILSLEELSARDPDWQHRLWTLIVDVERRLPSLAPITPAPFEVFVQRVLESPMLCRRASQVAVAGDTYVGFSGLRLMQDAPSIRQTGLTGVLTGYHRRGIATAMKLAVAQQAAQEGVLEIVTENDENNPMLSINLSLGYEPQPATCVLMCDLRAGLTAATEKITPSTCHLYSARRPHLEGGGGIAVVGNREKIDILQ